MAKLTAVRMNGIRDGYWSTEKKEALPSGWETWNTGGRGF